MSQCRVCWTEDETTTNRLIAPCRCSGTSERIHIDCWQSCKYQCGVCLFPDKNHLELQERMQQELERDITRLTEELSIVLHRKMIHAPPPRRRMTLIFSATVDVLAYIALVSTITLCLCRFFAYPLYFADYTVMTLCGLSGRGLCELFRYRYHLRRLRFCA